MRHIGGPLLLPLCLWTAGCSSEASQAERELSMLENARSSGDELCAAKRKVAAAYLHEGNEQKFNDAKLYADTTCSLAELDEGYARFGDEAGNIANAVDAMGLE